MFLQATYDESIIPQVEKALHVRGLNAEFYCGTINTIEFKKSADADDADYQVYYKDGVFTVYEWTWVSEDWAEYVYLTSLSEQEVLQA